VEGDPSGVRVIAGDELYSGIHHCCDERLSGGRAGPHRPFPFGAIREERAHLWAFSVSL